MIRVSVQREPIDIVAEHDRLAGGAIATFTGLVRADDGVTMLELEHYPGATEAALLSRCETAVARWALSGATIVHRIGAMVPGERIVFVGTASAHRAAALDACAFLIDRLKTDAPFWKCETRGDIRGWVDPRVSDGAAASRWDARTANGDDDT